MLELSGIEAGRAGGGWTVRGWRGQVWCPNLGWWIWGVLKPPLDGGQEQESQKLQLPLFPDTLEAFPFSKISFLFQINKPPASINLLAKTHVAPNLSAGRAEMPAGVQETPRPGLLGAGAAPSARGSPAPLPRAGDATPVCVLPPARGQPRLCGSVAMTVSCSPCVLCPQTACHLMLASRLRQEFPNGPRMKRGLGDAGARLLDGQTCTKATARPPRHAASPGAQSAWSAGQE